MVCQPDKHASNDEKWVPPAAGSYVFFRGHKRKVIASHPEAEPPHAACEGAAENETIYLGRHSEHVEWLRCEDGADDGAEKIRERNAIIVRAEIVARNDESAMFELRLRYAGGVTQKVGPYDVHETTIGRLLHLVGVEKWSELEGRPIRARASYVEVAALGHIVEEDDWMTLPPTTEPTHD